jgi:hypothetical protein
VPADAVRIATRDFDEQTRAFQGYGGITERRRAVIRTEDEWRAAWALITSHVSPRPPLPAVDFGRDIILLAAMGTRPTGGYAIDIAPVYQQDGELYAVVQETSPGSACPTTQALTHPLRVVLVARTDAPVHFVEHTAVRDCD